MPSRISTSSPFGWTVASVPNHTVFGFGLLLDANKRPVIYRGSPDPLPITSTKRRRVFRYRLISRLRPRMSMNNATQVCQPNARNYYHWMTETLPRLYFLKCINWKEPIIIGNHLLKNKWVGETLRLFPDLDFVFISSHQRVHVRNLFLVDEGPVAEARTEKDKLLLRNSALLKAMRDFLLTATKSDWAKPYPKRVHLSRQKGPRKISNIRDVRVVLDKFGFEEIYMQDLPLGTQFALAANAELIFAPHGAGLANMIFMKDGGAIIEVKHIRTFRQERLFAGLSQSMGLSYYPLNSEREAGRQDDFFVNPEMLEATLAEAVAAHGAVERN